MGLLVDGKWQDSWYDTKSSGGKFQRSEALFRNWVTADGSVGPSGEGGFKAEAGRYHLYISHACPWANRVAIFRVLKELESLIDVSVVDWYMADQGWTFDKKHDDAVGDNLHNFDLMSKVYTAAQPDVTCRVTVPVLWDKQQATIVSNESSEIIRMFNSAFDGFTGNTEDFYPENLRGVIDEVNERIYHTVNNGVYKCGFATTQTAYEDAFHPMFETLDWLEEKLSSQRYLIDDQITEADWRLFTTLIRFDAVYVGHFKCNRQRIADYPNLFNYTRELYQWPGVAETIRMDHIKNHYYASHETINPTRIVPVGPDLNFDAPHDRARFA
ncbi:glutathione S-transferase family protein [Ahrensia sp. R2A130]|uniref:glutathione S-transferase family protein n=1 Tax=Ahrensia sp. R2A130 TaxID=744979 RepID=UPI0001E0F8A7|nr:glutathione S-transferase family protein [Ahrensia sp. R2A130]EFL89044.1 glutathione S-transferase domain protein [Ahrensia sp. R2A130]